MVRPGVFVDRLGELGSLERLWGSGEPALVIVYGRRRIGKTRLLLEWVSDKPSAYYQAGLYSHSLNLEEMARALEEGLGLRGLSEARFERLDSLLGMALSMLGDRRAVVIIDEFTYWVRAYPGVASELQAFVDHRLPDSKMILVVAGSVVGLLERGLLGGGAPLYGRASARLRLPPLSPWCLPYFAPRYSSAELVELYSLVGGVPFYLNLISDDLPPLEAYLDLFSPNGMLGDEPLFILRDEFRDPHPYHAILRALAEGRRRLGEIASMAGMPLGHVSRYISTLQAVGLMEAEELVPRRRPRLYRINDRLLDSYYTIIEPLRHLLVHSHSAAQRQLERRAQYLYSKGWEEIARLHSHILADSLHMKPDTAGRFLYKGVEVDYVIIDHDEKKVLAVEAKWAKLSGREVRAVSREIKAKLQPHYPDHEIIPAIYAQEAETPPGENTLIVTVNNLPWKNCPTPDKTAPQVG